MVDSDISLVIVLKFGAAIYLIICILRSVTHSFLLDGTLQYTLSNLYTSDGEKSQVLLKSGILLQQPRDFTLYLYLSYRSEPISLCFIGYCVCIQCLKK